ncbi:MAG: hypothetical protein KF729_22015 [Sandaracinaceae bacterium]|nr:hypothetical protein [Sandaracinaceae bacterium]
MRALRFVLSLALPLALSGCGLMLDDPRDAGAGTHLDAASADAGAAVTCGAVVCGDGLECCNASCGICAPPGAGCAAIECLDAGGFDAGALDAGALDGGALDAGALDAGALDAGAFDAGALDAGGVDAAAADAGTTSCGSMTCAPGQLCCAGCGGARTCVTGAVCPMTTCSCTTNAECAPDEYCHRADLGCTGAGVCARRPTACPADCGGVCGCDGITYCNACTAHSAGVRVATNGRCARPRDCGPMDAHSDGECAAIAGYAWDGFHCRAIDCRCVGTACPAILPSLELCQAVFVGCVCGGFASLPCELDEYCEPEPDPMCSLADGTGGCRPLAPSGGCPEVLAPVCACDGNTYPNACRATFADGRIRHQGACR